jgi:hypothetical protein
MVTSYLRVRVEPAELVWDGVAEWPELARWIGDDVAPALRAGVPCLRDVGTVAQSPHVRPPGHRRAFYSRYEHGVIAVKGSEPFAANFTDMLDDLRKGRVNVELRLGSPSIDRTLTRTELNGLDKLAVLEGKLPGCVTVREALGEAQAAFAVQRAYVAHFGAPARLPLPIFVGKWPEDRVTMVREALRSRMRDRALHIAEAALSDGIGVYVYHYPAVPFRLGHLSVPDARKGKHIAKRLESFAADVDARATLEAWLELTARLLAVGFVAKDPASIVTGDCLQVQNVCLDGGFMDVESLTPSAPLDERALREALRRTAHELSLDATRLIAGHSISTVDMRDRLPELVAFVWADLATRVEAHGASDPRVLDILKARDTFAALKRTLELAL